MGNGYFRTSQTRKDKRRAKELTYNYVDRVRLAEHSLQQDYKCPTRGSGWRHNNKSISHLDLATSCHSTAFGPSHWSHNRQLRHSRSLDYAHLGERCKDPLDIAEFYWRLDPEGDALYEDEYEDELPDENEEIVVQRYNGEQRQEPVYRDYNYVNNSQQQHLHPPHSHHNTSSSGSGGIGGKTTSTAGPTNLQAFDFGNESCSLRRSRSLAVIREETFSDLQITAPNNSRRSQLIPRARIVNRGLGRERERLICGGGSNNKHHHHHHHHHLHNNNSGSCSGSCSGSGNNNLNTSEELCYEAGESNLQQHSDLRYNQRHHHHHRQHHIVTSDSGNQDNLQIHQTHTQSPTTALVTQQRNLTQPQSPSQQQQKSQSHPQQSRESVDYYDNLKRLDALTLGLVEQLHPWHNEKSDLESLNSDYFKNSLHQNQELQQQLDFEALEEAVSFLANEKPRIYQTRRQQRGILNNSLSKLQNASDSYQENSQSSAFPETTTSNSDDQTDSASLSEQEYDLKRIEKIYKKSAEFEGDEEGYELISLTTTTRTRFETTEEEEEEEDVQDLTVEEDGVLKRTRALSGKLEKLIAYDSVYLSSEESSGSTLHADDNNGDAYERTTHLTAKLEAEDTGETSTLLHFSIEDIIYEPQHNTQLEQSSDGREEREGALNEIGNIWDEAEALTEIETRTATKEEQLISFGELANTKIVSSVNETTELVAGEKNQKGGKDPKDGKETVNTQEVDSENSNKKLETTTLYTQILKVGHTSTLPITTSDTCKAQSSSLTSITTFEGIYTSAATCATTTSPSIVTKSTATSTNTSTSKPTATSTSKTTITSTSKSSTTTKAPSKTKSTDSFPSAPAPSDTSNTTTPTTTTSSTTITCLAPAITLTPANAKPAAVSTSSSTQPTVGITSSAASKPKILSVVEKRKWKRHSDNQATHSTHSSGSSSTTHKELRTSFLDPIVSKATSSPPIDCPLRAKALKRQATADSLTYLPFKQTNLSDNQYHSLPDVNIGQSLKVSECIDAKLRSSYNVNYTKLNKECSALGREGVKDKVTALTNGSAGTKTALSLETSANKCKAKQQRAAEIVTSEEIYDSIKRFGRAHQKARQKEYQELHEVLHVVKEKKGDGKEKKSVRIRETEKQLREVKEVGEKKVTKDLGEQKEAKDEKQVEIKKEVEAEKEAIEQNGHEEVKEQLTTYPDSLVDEIGEKTEKVEAEIEGTEKCSRVQIENQVLLEKQSPPVKSHTHLAENEVTNDASVANSSLETNTSEYLEQPKGAPDVEVEDFSKLIERRAKEIKEKADKRTQDSEGPATTITELKGSARIRQLDVDAQPVKDFRISACVSQFRIIVTDAQNNIIEEDSIEKEASLSSCIGKVVGEEEAHTPHVSQTHTSTAHKLQKLNVFADVTISRQESKKEKREKKEKSVRDKSTIVSTQTHRVATLKRVPSKPKRQQQQQQQQQNLNTSHQQHLHCCQQHQQQQRDTNKDNNKISKDVRRQNETTPNKAKSKLGDTADISNNNNTNYCNLTLKSKERRVLSTQIYKARPVKVLTANDSFRRRSKDGAVTAAGSKMSRPQILHVVDNSKRRANIFGSSSTANNELKARGGGGPHDDGRQTECEYLKKVDAVRNYWSKLAQIEENEQNQSEGDKRDEIDGGPTVNGDSQMRQAELRSNKENANKLTSEVMSGRKGDDAEQGKGRPQTESQQTQTEQQRKEGGEQQRKQCGPQPTQMRQQLAQSEQKRSYPESRHFILGAPVQTQQTQTQRTAVNQVSKPPRLGTTNTVAAQQDDFASFMPSIEIVELDGDKKATIVSAMPPDSADAAALANDANGVPQFDHIRYKVLKSQQLLRSNMVPRSKKEAQFDGLIQYLQEYSFQELLANNNVVIVEPVRTKIERPITIAKGGAVAGGMAERRAESAGRKMEQQLPVRATTKDDNGIHRAYGKKLFGGFGIPNTVGGDYEGGGGAGSGGGSSGGIKRHFFYQPVRVNRELYEEELPNPDIVRNVRKFFEENVLPTPRGGMQVRSKTPTDDNSYVERSAATQLPSPRARRARKYRYLTIDTSYGHMPQQHRNHQQQQQPAGQQQINPKTDGSAKTRKWDTASLSSGISSGDLSSPCECTDVDSANAKHAAGVEDNSLKGVHVQEVVQQHNNRNMQKGASERHAIETNACRIKDERQVHPRPRPRPRSSSSSRVIRSGGGDDSTYRVTDIYEQHASQQQQRNFLREGRSNGFGVASAELTETDDDEYADDEDLDDEVGESHYVSKDVLEKIRECGSTVTYYGGRVLQSNSPDPLHCGGVHNGANTNSSMNNNYNGHANSGNTNTMTLTRRRVRQIESSNACEPPKDCTNQQSEPQSKPQPLPQPLKQNFAKQLNEGQHKNKNKTNSTTENVDVENRESSLAHFGIKFKLVKSNSCSSRLELAGTGAEIIETGADDTEVVKKMVHHFECTRQRTSNMTDKEEPLTINNQTPARKLLFDNGKASTVGGVGDAIKQVTVNNHINVPMTTYALDDDSTKTHQQAALNNKNKGTCESNNKTETEQKPNEKTYQSSAMDIRLSNADQRKCSNGGDDGGTLKVWRNKNVDLAIAMVKKQQQQQQQQGKGLSADSGQSSESTIILSQKGNQSETSQTSTQSLDTTTSSTVAHMKNVLESNKPLPKIRKDNQIGSGKRAEDDGNDVNVALEKNTVRNVEAYQEQSSNGNEVKSMIDISVQAQTSSTATTTPILAPRSTQLPAQIVVPVEIHRAEQQETPEPYARSISVASSRGSSVTTVITTTNSSMMLDKNVVRQYVANDKSLFERRKYDDIEFEEFEVYDPTKDYEKLVENEKRREEAKREGREQSVQQQQPKYAEQRLIQQQPSRASAATSATSDSDARYDDEEELKSDSYDYDSLEDKL